MSKWNKLFVIEVFQDNFEKNLDLLLDLRETSEKNTNSTESTISQKIGKDNNTRTCDNCTFWIAKSTTTHDITKIQGRVIEKKI